MTSTTTKQNGRPGHADVETAILEAARDLLADGGITGLSMRQIADRVGVTATAIYHYFDGKQEIVNRVVISAFERFGAYLKDAMAEHPVGSIERLHSLGEAYIRFAFENDAYFRVIFSIQPKSHAGLDGIPEGGGYHLLRKTVAEAIDAGAIKPRQDEVGEAEHADVVSMYLWSLAHGLVTLTMCGAGDRCDCQGKPDAVRLLKAFGPFVDHGIRLAVDDTSENEDNEERCNCE
jgi:AcrR family transcriptional regulator